MKKKSTTTEIQGFKGYDKNFKCRDMQYKIGKDYETKEKPVRCTKHGYHFCTNPFDVFGYYPPSQSRFGEVTGSGDVSADESDTKVAVSKIHIGAEISLHDFITKGIKFIFEKTTLTKEKTNTESKLQASNSGYSGAASNSGNSGAASNSGNSGAAFSVGYNSSSETTGEESIACAVGINNKAKGDLGCWLVLSEYKEGNNYTWHLKYVKSVLVDGKKIKANTFYYLINGKFVKA
jgi:hypothetical protein